MEGSKLPEFGSSPSVFTLALMVRRVRLRPGHEVSDAITCVRTLNEDKSSLDTSSA
jgi:hypothetical protein